MARKLEIHPASSEERIQIYRNVFEFWPMAASLEEHLQLRLNSPKHERAHWYAGCLDGEVVASLGCHPLRYHFDGREVEGFSIGSVHTLPEYRRQGFAAEVMNWAESDQRQKGARISSLYSDIDPQYYGKLGYLPCPSWIVWAEAGSSRTRTADRAWTLMEFSPSRFLSDLDKHYRDYHGSYPLAIARSLDYWKFTLIKQPQDEFHWLKDPAQRTQGYVRLTNVEGALHISDFAVSPEQPEALKLLFEMVISLSGEKKKSGVRGWLPNDPSIRSLFDIQPRTQAVTMVKSLDADLEIVDRHLATADRFCKIDHV